MGAILSHSGVVAGWCGSVRGIGGGDSALRMRCTLHREAGAKPHISDPQESGLGTRAAKPALGLASRCEIPLEGSDLGA